jgi:UDP-galactopyranose mutase
MNYTDLETPYTRVIEHKHFNPGNQPRTVVTREYPLEWQPARRHFTRKRRKNQSLYERYRMLAAAESGVVFGGRLGEYRYYDMDRVVLSALEAADRELGL